MKKLTLTQIMIATAVLFGTAQFAAAESAETKYTYKGHEDAREICMAIAKDQPTRLKRALDARKFGRLDNKVHTRYTCDGKDLISFANREDAVQVVKYLAPKYGQESDMSIAAK